MARNIAGIAWLFAVAGFACAQPNFDPPPAFPPDAETMKQIAVKTAELKAAIAKLPDPIPGSAVIPSDIRADVEIYLKAVEWIVRHGEFFAKDSGKQTLVVLDAGLSRAKAAATGKTPWRDVRNKPITRGYYSKIDGSVQPFSVTLPEGYGNDGKKWRLDVVLHGRDSTLTEVKYIAGWENAKPTAKGNDFVVLQAFGRGNNAYRWAGETDVIEGLEQVSITEGKYLDPQRRVLRGFSMGGAGTWHIGLHHPFDFNVIGPGAGFTNTRGYIKNLPEKLPDYIEKCLHIYDAVDYAENAFNVPVVAYSGSLDPQKAAADNIEKALKGFELPLRFTHLVAPGLEHKMPPEWAAKAEVEYGKYANAPRKLGEHTRFVTYTSKFDDLGIGTIYALEKEYVKSIVEIKSTSDKIEMSTTNIKALLLRLNDHTRTSKFTVDGQTIAGLDAVKESTVLLRKVDGKWTFGNLQDENATLQKRRKLQGPIDDAFGSAFRVVPPSANGWSTATSAYLDAAQKHFAHDWDKYFRGALPMSSAEKVLALSPDTKSANWVLFGDPSSNPVIKDVLPKLPIKWTAEVLVVNGVTYDAKTHIPVMIYLSRSWDYRYIVLNSGHTFKEADLKGTNALLYPRLGDWAVLKLAPTANDPHATAVVAAGLFDENWQFPKK